MYVKLKFKNKKYLLFYGMRYAMIPFTCCTDVNFRSQWSSNGWGAVISNSEVYCRMPLAVV